MAKRGQTFPYKVDYRHEGRPQYRVAKPTEDAALMEARKIAGYGAAVTVLYRDPEGTETVLAHLDADHTDD